MIVPKEFVLCKVSVKWQPIKAEMPGKETHRGTLTCLAWRMALTITQDPGPHPRYISDDSWQGQPQMLNCLLMPGTFRVNSSVSE